MSRASIDALTWLLQQDSPPVKYLVMRDIIGSDPQQLSSLRRELLAKEPVTSILTAQNADGSWCLPADLYNPKYRSTLWQLVLLAELGATADPRLDLAMAHVFPYLSRVTNGFRERDIHCLMGYGIMFLHQLGYGEHENARQLTELVANSYPELSWPCSMSSRPDCTWGMVKLLRGLASIPPRLRPVGTDRLVKGLAKGLLQHRFWFEPPVPGQPCITNRQWLEFGFPLFYESDLLEMLLALTEAGYGAEPRVRELGAIVSSLRAPEGWWSAGRDLDDALWAPFGPAGSPSPWVTVRALTVLSRLG